MRLNKRPHNFYPTLSVASFSPLPPLLPELSVFCTSSQVQFQTVKICQVQLSCENTAPTYRNNRLSFDLWQLINSHVIYEVFTSYWTFILETFFPAHDNAHKQIFASKPKNTTSQNHSVEWQCSHCCKNNQLKLQTIADWGGGVSELNNPWTDGHKIWHRSKWIMSVI